MQEQEPKEKFGSVWDYILQEEINFRTRRIPLATNYDWNMYEHIDKSFQLKNSQFTKGDNNSFIRPFKNIILPIANVNYRSEGFDVKNVNLYVENEDYYYLSLFARKFHARWAKKYSIDAVIDEIVESYFDYGLALVKNVNNQRPEVVDLKSDLVFCNQSDVLAGAICLKHDYSIDELLDMKGKWNGQEIDRAIVLSSFSVVDENGKESISPNKSCKVYELHGMFPENWLGVDKLGDTWKDTGKYTRQMHIVTYYKDSRNNQKGITLFKGKVDQIFKALKRDPIAKRACGRGGIEELFHPQIWINYSEIHLQQMLEATSKVVTKTTDKKFAQGNKLSDIKHNQIMYIEDGKTWEQMVIQPFNKVTFDNYVNSWEQDARIIGSASDPQLGLDPVSRTSLGTTKIVVNQGKGIHEYRQGKIAMFWGEIYRDWGLKYFVDEINKGDKWLDEFSMKELEEVANQVARIEVNKRIKDIVLSDGIVFQNDKDTFLQLVKDGFKKGGNKKFIEILKNDFKDLSLHVDFNVAGKQKDMYDVVNKLNNVFRTIFMNPAILQQNQGLADLFNQILESSGLSPVDFTSITAPINVSSTPMIQSPLQNQLPVNNQIPQ